MERRNRLVCFALAGLLAAAPAARADVKLPALIGDNMVLQRGLEVPIWGWADSGEKVTVAIAGLKAAATADSQGNWKLKLGPVQGEGPHVMTVAGRNSIEVRNVLVGEVWVCSGQSNMARATAQAQDGAEEVAAAELPGIRLFQVKHAMATEPQKDVSGQWVQCSPKTVGGFSAVGYFFGREIHRGLKVPVGLIHSSWGGTAARVWMSQTALESDPVLRGIVGEWRRQRQEVYPRQMAAYEKQLAGWQAAAEKARAEGKAPPPKPGAPADPDGTWFAPGSRYNAMIAPLMPCGIRGVIWYQGESDARWAGIYERTMALLIRSWRRQWGQGDFPFLFVQLANYMSPQAEPVQRSGWAEVRDAQRRNLSVPHTAMAVAIDIGEAGNIHPTNKKAVGQRLALAARARVYGEKLGYSGPLYDSMSVEGDRVRVRFKHVGGGLAARGGALKGFAISGKDGRWVWAEAGIDGDAVVVWSQSVKQPAAVRYAWANNPICNLYNKEGLPASPFRTDR
ncbi:MAG: hypothetical protein AMJ81_03180 [Phycisphaerae bacterium SM23_33]|nr:MAG: hypothetical protein AMJ81_03180 [Phycisphaerae bacterium SM23_33]